VESLLLPAFWHCRQDIHQTMRFFAGFPLTTPLEELTALPRPSSRLVWDATLLPGSAMALDIIGISYFLVPSLTFKLNVNID